MSFGQRQLAIVLVKAIRAVAGPQLSAMQIKIVGLTVIAFSRWR